MKQLEALFKTIIVTLVGTGVLIASFYFAYLLLIIIVLGTLGTVAYMFFNKDELFKSDDFPD